MSLNKWFLSKSKMWIVKLMLEESQECLLHKGIKRGIHHSTPHMSVSLGEGGGGAEKNTGQSPDKNQNFPS